MSIHRRGPENAKIELLEFVDYECPYSAQAEDSINRACEAFVDDSGESEIARLVRHFPLFEIHPDARMAAVAAEAASRQERFWQMHALLLENQDELSPELVFQLAEGLNLDLPRFARDVQNPDCESAVRKDRISGEELGVEETPAVFVNGARIHGRVDFLALSRAIVRELKDEAA